MNRTIIYQIKEAHGSVRAFLQEKRYPHAVLTQLKQAPEQVCKNGAPSLLRAPLTPGDVLRVDIPERPSREKILPADLPLSILYEDDDLLVIDKPAGMPVHPSQDHYTDTLANAVRHYLPDTCGPFVFRCINRLDKNTSGLLLVAKNRLSGAILSQDIKNRRIRRRYQAVVSGVLTKDGTIDAPIARAQDSSILRCIDYAGGQRAVTHYRILKTYEDRTLLELQLETGRTHQIRVHMASIGHPLLGDGLYHPAADDGADGRQALHACFLSFTHPVTGEGLSFSSPLPKDILRLLPS